MPFAVMFTYFGTPLFASADSWIVGVFHVILVGIGAYLPAGIVLWLAAMTVLRHRRQVAVPAALVAAVGGVAWTVRSLVLVATMDALRLPDQVAVVARVLTGFLEGALAVLLAAWFLSSLDQFHQRRSELLDELARAEHASEELASGVEELRASLLARTRRMVAESMDEITIPAEGAPWSSAHVRSLEAATEHVAHRISRDLLRAARRDSRLNLRSVVRCAAGHRPFAYWGLLPTLVLALIVLPMLWPAPAAIAVALSTTAVACALAMLANHLIPRLHPRGRSVAYGVAVLMLFVTTVGTVRIGIAVFDLGGPSTAALPWLFAVNLGILFPLIGLAAATGRTKDQILAGVQRSITQAEVRQESVRLDAVRICREIALALHGGAQARLTATRMRLGKALDEGDFSDARAALLEARRAVELEIDIEDSVGLPEMVAGLVDAWSGVLAITAHIDVRRPLDRRDVTMVREILEEAVTNAARHADARQVEVQISDDREQLTVRVADDGRGVEGSATPGLGTEMLNALAPGAWKLTTQPEGGSTLTVVMTRHPPSP